MPQTYQQKKERRLRLAAIAAQEKDEDAKLLAVSAAAAGASLRPEPTPSQRLTPAAPMKTISMHDATLASAPVAVEDHVDDDPDFAPVAPATGAPVTPQPHDPDLVPIHDAATPRKPLYVAAGEAFAQWLASPQGVDCTDPRQPNDPVRKRADLESRLKLAFMAGATAAMGC